MPGDGTTRTPIQRWNSPTWNSPTWNGPNRTGPN
jgi:hypothetical protein